MEHAHLLLLITLAVIQATSGSNFFFFSTPPNITNFTAPESVSLEWIPNSTDVPVIINFLKYNPTTGSFDGIFTYFAVNPPGSRVTLNIDPARIDMYGTGTLRINDTTPNDAGQYKCSVQSSNALYSSTVTLFSLVTAASTSSQMTTQIQASSILTQVSSLQTQTSSILSKASSFSTRSISSTTATASTLTSSNRINTQLSTLVQSTTTQVLLTTSSSGMTARSSIWPITGSIIYTFSKATLQSTTVVVPSLSQGIFTTAFQTDAWTNVSTAMPITNSVAMAASIDAMASQSYIVNASSSPTTFPQPGEKNDAQSNERNKIVGIAVGVTLAALIIFIVAIYFVKKKLVRYEVSPS